MTLKHAMWLHGHGLEIEYSNRIESVERKGYYIRVHGKENTTNWIHGAIPTPVIVEDQRLKLKLAQLRIRGDGNSSLEAIHIWDGEVKIGQDNSFNEKPTEWKNYKVSPFFDVEGREDHLAVFWGIGISFKVSFPSGGSFMDISTVGCDFIEATGLCPQRFSVLSNSGKVFQLPYLSSAPIDAYDPAVERIVIAQHGTGGTAKDYYEGTIEAAKLVPGALAQTLIIAPQFIGEDEYYRAFPNGVLYWPNNGGGRAYGYAPASPGSAGITSFDVLDQLLERVCNRTIFPNLTSIILAGHSNGGQFMNRYAAVSQFEQKIATNRGVKIRHIVMNPGSYLYFDKQRAQPGSFNEFKVPTAGNCPGFNDYPFGLDNLKGYATNVSKQQIREQYPQRNVIYLVGEDDTSQEGWNCKDLLQGKHRLERGLIYFNYLRNYFGDRILDTHRLEVVPNIGHNGYKMLSSSIGLKYLFGTAGSNPMEWS